MDCASVRERLRELVRGELVNEDNRGVREHLAACEGCRHEERAERLLDEALATRLPKPSAPAGLRRRIAGELGRASCRERVCSVV